MPWFVCSTPSLPTSPPPGFPTTPQYDASFTFSPTAAASPHVSVSLIGDQGMMSPLSANIQALQSTFYGANKEADANSEINALLRHDDRGDLGLYDDLQMRYIMSNGFTYRTGHGRDRCSHARCVVSSAMKDDVIANNCAFHPQYILPLWFKPCSSDCRGAYCSCLKTYPDYFWMW